MKLYFVRHGQTDFNKNKIPQGQEINVPLNEIGIKQVENILDILPDDIDFIISSPMKRTVQTAEIINKKLLKRIDFADDIKELKYGSLAGKTWQEIVIETGDSDVRQKDKDTLFDYKKWGGDSAEDLKQRVAKFVRKTKENTPTKIYL